MDTQDQRPEQQDGHAAGVCPKAKKAIVFRDTSRNWKGRYVDQAGYAQDVPLSGHDGEQARQALAQYLGIRPDRVRVIEATGRRY